MVSLSWLRQTQREWKIPDIIPERCVHQHCEIASCTRCVDSCPTSAWRLDEGGLRIDTTLCDSCGLCVAACPQQALVQTHYPLLGLINQHKSLLAYCERCHGVKAGKGVVPCLHIFSLSTLAEYYQLGYRHLYVASGECEQCERFGKTATLQQTLHSLNQLLESRQVEPIQLTQLDQTALKSYHKHLMTVQADQTATSRRQFFRQAVTLVAETVEQGELTTEMMAPAQSITWVARLPHNTTAGVTFPYVPIINAERCNGCDACVQLCPQQALKLEQQADTLAYQVQVERCNGCGVCVDGCDQQALQIEAVKPAPEPLALTTAHCKACGSPFHYPTQQASPNYCRICTQTNHYRRLYQVY